MRPACLGKTTVPQSRYVTWVFREFSHIIPSSGKVLDIPCGFGRHSVWLSEAGYSVISADIDTDRILSFTTISELATPGACSGRVVDANMPLVFVDAPFDIVLIVDFVNLLLLRHVSSWMKSGSLLIYETFANHGENWRSLLPTNLTRSVLEPYFEFVHYESRRCGPIEAEVETIRFVAVRSNRYQGLA